MNLTQWLQALRTDSAFSPNIAAWHTVPAREARYADYPADADSRLVDALKGRGIERPYTHQRQAWDAVREGKDIVVVTPTASGKSLCYHFPVLDDILKNPQDRALYLFPTKALSSDQVAELMDVITAMDAGIKAFTYDGDTNPTARKAVRQAGHIVVTNPDMLHSGILPQHTHWVKLFENLRYVVIDEIHTYRGVFGSHLAHVLRRLKRICAFYGSDPQFICCSATIANPGELASRLIDRPVKLIDDNGAPSGERNLILYNPPIVNKALGLRASCLGETRRVASDLIKNGISTIVFARSRLQVEVLTTYLKDLVRDRLGMADAVRGYRGGYLPGLRRQIERGLRQGSIRGVVSTNALELGVDIGSLEACVLCGYPGSVASTYQQAGRAGRRQGVSAAVLVATSSPLDQYMMRHPDFFFEAPPENGHVAPDNLYILMNHLKCALAELPFEEGETFGAADESALEYLQQEGVARHTGGKWYFSAADVFPTQEISLRSATGDVFTIIDITNPEPRVLGETDRMGAQTMLHEEAIYLHEARSYQVEKLDFEQKKAFVREVDADYYTDADTQIELSVLDEWERYGQGDMLALGDVRVTSMVSVFKKIKFDTHENIGWGKVQLPDTTVHTTACWLSLEEGRWTMEKSRLQDALVGVSNLLAGLAPVYLLCDPRDFRVVCQVRSPHTGRPTIYLYDAYTGGVGLAEKLVGLMPTLLEAAREQLMQCSCQGGCPACIGPDGDKEAAGRLLEEWINACKAPEA
nr:DEAD/DEAH box helicase [bacterium]